MASRKTSIRQGVGGVGSRRQVLAGGGEEVVQGQLVDRAQGPAGSGRRICLLEQEILGGGRKRSAHELLFFADLSKIAKAPHPRPLPEGRGEATHGPPCGAKNAVRISLPRPGGCEKISLNSKKG